MNGLAHLGSPPPISPSFIAALVYVDDVTSASTRIKAAFLCREEKAAGLVVASDRTEKVPPLLKAYYCPFWVTRLWSKAISSPGDGPGAL